VFVANPLNVRVGIPETNPLTSMLALFDVGEEHGDAEALARGFSLEQRLPHTLLRPLHLC